MTPQRIALAWSGGKDSALALHALQQRDDIEIVTLLTTLSRCYDRVSHHGVPAALLEAQAAVLGLSLTKVYLPDEQSGWCSDEAYGEVMREALLGCQARGITSVAGGDLFLESARVYREKQLARLGMTPLFPLWGRDTGQLAQQFIDLGFRAKVVCVELAKLDRTLAGHEWDASLLAALPDGVDPCGENGEFHSFVYDGPMFREPVRLHVAGTVVRQAWCLADLRPG